MRGATLFSGGGGVEARLKDCIEFVHAVEYDPAIAAVYRQNHGDHIQVAKVEDVDYSLWGALDYLHASPVCKEYSQAKTGGVEGEGDISSALAVVRCLEQTQPRVFTLENVGAYQHGKAYRLICTALSLLGYMWHAEVLNSADYGVPQTRRRLILRAVKDALLPGLSAPLPWVGWYAAIEDLIPGLPESRFADWQLQRLPDYVQSGLLVSAVNADGTTEPRQGCLPSFTVQSSAAKQMPRAFIVAGNGNQANVKAFIVDGQTNDNGAGVTLPQGNAPMYIISASMEKRPARAWLINSDNASRDLTMRADGDPAFTIGANYLKTPHRAWLSAGRVVKMSARALARFQSIPDSYVLPEKSSLACTIIGNAVPPLLMREIVKPLL